MNGILHQSSNKIKGYFGDPQNFVFFVVLLTAVASFGLGRLSVLESVQADTLNFIRADDSSRAVDMQAAVISSKSEVDENNFVASESGSRYYPAGCSGISRIHEENRIYFATEEEARASGRTRSVRCSW